jgi:cytosolic 5'-nucleotidase 3
MASPAKKTNLKKKSVARPSTHHSADQYDDVSHLFLSTSGTIATVLHSATSTGTETIRPVQVVTKSKAALLDKYQSLVQDGASKLKIVSDFDFTLTKFYIYKPTNKNKDSTATSHPQVNPITETRRSSVSTHISTSATSAASAISSQFQRGISCHAVLEDCHLFSQEYQDQSVAIFQKYYPLEMDPHIAYEKKFQYMMEWTKEIHNSLQTKALLTKSHIEQAVNEAVAEKRIDFRARVYDFFQAAFQCDLPLLVFSGGLADIAEKVVECCFQDPYLLRKVHFLANRCIFDADGKLAGFQEPLVHALNKKAATFLTSCPFFHSEENSIRRNVIVIGDSAKDILMIMGMDYDAEKCLKIGFLNDKVTESFDSYLDIFDIVIMGDEAGFDIPLEILQNICHVDGHTLYENAILQEEIRQLQGLGTTNAGYEEAFAYDADTGYDVADGFEGGDVDDYGNYGD